MSIYLFQVASQKSDWLSARQTAVASNVANASTPGYRAVDVQPFSTILKATPIAMTATSGGHLSSANPALDSIREVDAPER